MLIAINYPVSGLKFAIVVFIVVVIAVAIVVHTCYIHPYLIKVRFKMRETYCKT